MITKMISPAILFTPLPFEFRLHPVETLLSGLILYPMNRTLEVLQLYREFSRTTPDELTA